MLEQLPQLTAVSLGVHSCWGSELDAPYGNCDLYYPDTSVRDEWEHSVQLPPLGGLTALTELYIAGRAALPPDFGQLRRLRRLTVVGGFSCGHTGDDEPAEVLEWGCDSLAPLASLTRVELIDSMWGYLEHPGERSHGRPAM